MSKNWKSESDCESSIDSTGTMWFLSCSWKNGSALYPCKGDGRGMEVWPTSLNFFCRPEKGLSLETQRHPVGVNCNKMNRLAW